MTVFFWQCHITFGKATKPLFCFKTARLTPLVHFAVLGRHRLERTHLNKRPELMNLNSGFLLGLMTEYIGHSSHTPKIYNIGIFRIWVPGTKHLDKLETMLLLG